MEHDGRRPPGGALSACTKCEKWSGKTGGRANFERLMCHEWMQESRESVWRGEAKVRLANPEDAAVNSTVFGIKIEAIISRRCHQKKKEKKKK